MYEWMLPVVSKKQGQPDLPSVLDMSKSLLGVYSYGNRLSAGVTVAGGRLKFLRFSIS